MGTVRKVCKGEMSGLEAMLVARLPHSIQYLPKWRVAPAPTWENISVRWKLHAAGVESSGSVLSHN